MEKEYKGYTFGDYFESELDGIEWWQDGDGYRKDGIYFDEDELVEQEWDNFKDWVNEQEEM